MFYHSGKTILSDQQFSFKQEHIIFVVFYQGIYYYSLFPKIQPQSYVVFHSDRSRVYWETFFSESAPGWETHIGPWLPFYPKFHQG